VQMALKCFEAAFVDGCGYHEVYSSILEQMRPVPLDFCSKQSVCWWVNFEEIVRKEQS